MKLYNTFVLLNLLKHSLIIDVVLARTTVRSMADCQACISSSTYVCKAEFSFTSAFCCDTGSDESLSGCYENTRQYCTSSMSIDNMKHMACPMSSSSCGDTYTMSVGLDSPKSAAVIGAEKKFTTSSVCYYRMTVDTQDFDLVNYSYELRVSF